MPVSKYKVELTQSERSALIEASCRGKPLARTVKRALVLLKADEGLSDCEAAEAVSISAATVARVRRRFVEEGVEAAINDRPRSGRGRKLNGKQEAHLVAVACSNACERTLQLLGNLPGDGAPDELKPWKKKEWCIQGERGVRGPDGGCAGPVLYDPERPVVCFDETSKQLIEDVRLPIKAKPGRVERYDTEYQRNGTRNLFMFCEPKGGWRPSK